MKVLLIYPDYPDLGLGGCYYEGIASIFSAINSTKNHTAEFAHITKKLNNNSLKKTLDNIKPDVIAYSITTPMFEYVKIWSALIGKHYPDLIQICGGVHARLDYENILTQTPIKFVCIGEGEIAFIELLDKIEAKEEYSNTHNFAFLINGKIVKNELRLIENLDLLHPPKRDIFNHLTLYEYNRIDTAKVASFIFTRGCPYSCSYCCNNRLRRDYKDKSQYVRRISPENAIQQIIDHLDKYPFTDCIRLYDNIINLDRQWFNNFSKLYKKNVNVPYTCFTIASLCDEEFLSELAYSGCFLLIMGIEHEGEKYRQKILNRHITDNEILKAFKMSSKFGIATQGLNMFGLPFDTLNAIIETIRLNAEAKVYDMKAFPFQPHPQTRLGILCKKENFSLVKVNNKNVYNNILMQSTISIKETQLALAMINIILFQFGMIYKFEKSKNQNMALLHQTKQFECIIKKMACTVKENDLEQIELVDKKSNFLYKEIICSNIKSHRDLLTRYLSI